MNTFYKIIILSLIYILSLKCTTVLTRSYTPRPTLLVTPFINLSRNKEHDFFAVGLSDELSRKLNDSKRFIIIDPALVFKQIAVAQLQGNEVQENQLIVQARRLDAMYGIVGKVKIDDKQKTLHLNAKVIRTSDNVLLANETESGTLDQWSLIRGRLAIKVNQKLGIPLSTADQSRLMSSETRDIKAFRLNFIGKMYEYKSREAQYKRLNHEAVRYKNLAMAFWARAAAKDNTYRAPQNNYVNAMDAGDVRSSTEKLVEKTQGSLNAMIMYGFLYKKNRVFNPEAWVNANATELRKMISGLPEGYVVEIQGHTDSTGPEEPEETKPGNLAISKNRARSVYQAMLNSGISKKRLLFRGYGSSRTIPWLKSKDPSNRRVTFEVKPGAYQ